MSETTKLQAYKYSLRTTAIANVGTCEYIFFVYQVPPDNAITIENMYVHLIFQFSALVAVGDRKIIRIGIADSRPSTQGTPPNRLRTYDGNWSADANRIVDLKIDLSALLKKDNVRWRERFVAPTTNDATYLYIEIPSAAGTLAISDTIKLCKMDCLYTTLGIR